MKTIVVGYDGTRAAERALERATELAQALGARLIVADIVPPEPLEPSPAAFGMPPSYVATHDQSMRNEQALWQQHRDRIDSFLRQTGTRYEFAGAVGSPAAAIAELAEDRNADLIVVGTQSPGLLERLFGASVDLGVARQARCDVLIVSQPPDDSDARGAD